MKRSKTCMPKRPRMASSGTARTSKDAAISLVRLEFDAARLEMGISQARDRAKTYESELKRNKAERKQLLQALNG